MVWLPLFHKLSNNVKTKLHKYRYYSLFDISIENLQTYTGVPKFVSETLPLGYMLLTAQNNRLSNGPIV